MAESETEFSLSKKGRKKSHPVWNYFVDLKSSASGGTNEIIKCKNCSFETSEKNPQTLISHIKENHSEGRRRSLWNCLEKESNEFIKHKNNQKLNSLMAGIRGTKQAGVLEELSKQVATFGSVTMDKDDIVGLLQTFANKVDPNEASSIEGLVSALGEPSTSGNTTFGSSENDCEIISVKSPTPTALKNEEWILIGTYNDHQSVEAARNAGKVVRHSIIPMKQGSKVKYRCNQWKRTHCPYRMHYVEQDGIYQLYEKGQHEHTPLQSQGQSQSSSTVNNEASDEQQQYMGTDYLQSIISHAIQATTYESQNNSISEYSAPPFILEEHIEPKVETESSPCLTLPENLLNVFHEAVKTETSENFTLSNSISNLLEVATQLQLVFTFDARNAAEFCFSKSSNPEMIVFVDFGTDVIVKTKHNDFTVNEERWKKSDSVQFMWAVRGILAKTFSK